MNPILSSLINSEIDVSNLLFQFESLISNLIRDLNAEVSTPRNNDPKKISQNIPSQSDMVLQQLKYFQTLYKDKLNDYRMKKFTFNRLCQQEYLQTKCYDFSGKLNTQIDLSQVQTIDASILLTTLNKLEQAYSYNSLIEQKYQSQYQQILEATKYLKSFNEAHEADKKQKEEEQKKREEERIQMLQQEKLRREQEEVERDRDAERQKQAAQQVVNPQVQVHNPQQQEIQQNDNILQNEQTPEDDRNSDTMEFRNQCILCYNEIEEKGLQFICKHFIHEECFKEQIFNALNQGSTLVYCPCNSLINSKLIVNLLRQLPAQQNQSNLELVFEKIQAYNLIKQYSHQKCKSCEFFYLTPGVYQASNEVEKCSQCT